VGWAVTGRRIVNTKDKSGPLTAIDVAGPTRLKKGANTLAVHSHEGGKGQWIDLGILVDKSNP
jgi:hypothetical protein